MAFTKFHPLVCQRAVIWQGEIIQGKPEICVGYFSMRNPYMKFQDDISNMNTYIHTYVHTYIHTYIHTYGQAETNMPPPPLFQSWGHNKSCVYSIELPFNCCGTANEYPQFIFPWKKKRNCTLIHKTCTISVVLYTCDLTPL